MKISDFRFPISDLTAKTAMRGSAGRSIAHRKSHIENQKAFTLLEILLAVTLIVGLMTALYGFYDSTLVARNELAVQRKNDFAQRRLLDLMAGELQATRFFPLMGQCLQGESQQVTFFRTVMPGPEVYYTPSPIEQGGAASQPSASPQALWEPQHDVQQVSYRLGHGIDENGADIVTGLERTCLRTLTALTAEEGSTVHVDPLSDQVKFLRLQYWDGQAWQDSWSANYVPPAVRITLGAEELPPELSPGQYPYETIWREVAIPCGVAPGT